MAQLDGPGKARQVSVSNIPTTAISTALTPVQRQTHESLRARAVQVQKNLHHVEDVEELDDTAVDSIRDQAQRNRRQNNQAEEDLHQPSEEKVDIESLQVTAEPPPQKSDTKDQSHLDISA